MTPVLYAEGPVEEAEVLGGQEEAAIFMEDTSFMQGAVGLTLMPSALSTRVPDADLAALARLIFGSDKLFGFFLSVGSQSTTLELQTSQCPRFERHFLQFLLYCL